MPLRLITDEDREKIIVKPLVRINEKLVNSLIEKYNNFVQLINTSLESQQEDVASAKKPGRILRAAKSLHDEIRVVQSKFLKKFDIDVDEFIKSLKNEKIKQRIIEDGDIYINLAGVYNELTKGVPNATRDVIDKKIDAITTKLSDIQKALTSSVNVGRKAEALSLAARAASQVFGKSVKQEQREKEAFNPAAGLPPGPQTATAAVITGLTGAGKVPPPKGPVISEAVMTTEKLKERYGEGLRKLSPNPSDSTVTSRSSRASSASSTGSSSGVGRNPPPIPQKAPPVPERGPDGRPIPPKSGGKPKG